MADRIGILQCSRRKRLPPKPLIFQLFLALTLCGWLSTRALLAQEPVAVPVQEPIQPQQAEAAGTTIDAGTTRDVPPSGEPSQSSQDATLTDETPLRSGLRWHVGGTWRLAGERTSALDLNQPESLRLTPNDRGEHRLRLGGDIAFAQAKGFVRELAVQLEADLRQANDTTETPDGFLMRKAFAEATTLAGRFGAGRTVAQWGLGLVAQNGVDDPMQFGFKRGGGIVDRVQYAILPAAILQSGDPLNAFPLALAAAYDRVRLDDLARSESDVAHHWILALLYRGKDLQAGVYGVKRDQTDAAGLGLRVLIGDAYVNYGLWTRTGWRLSIAGEVAVISGTSTWLRTISQPDHLDVAQWGGVIRGEAAHKALKVRLEGGFASGDDRPFDGTLRNFQFASDYHVGLVLFSQYMRLQSRSTMANLGDPRFTNGAPAGVEHVDTHGAVTQAMYLHPVVRVEAHPRLAVLAGAVWAQAPVDVADPYQTYLAGGVPTGPRGAKKQRDLGLEFDTAVEWNQPLGLGPDGGGLALLARLDAGVLLPGHAFDAADGTAATAVAAAQAQLALRGSW